MKPTVGRIVIYTNLGDKDGKFPPESQAAIITAVKPPRALHAGQLDHVEETQVDVMLAVFYQTGLFFMVDPVAFTSELPGTDAARGKWGWPPRV